MKQTLLYLSNIMKINLIFKKLYRTESSTAFGKESLQPKRNAIEDVKNSKPKRSDVSVGEGG